ncbi:MAG: hypothetical protein ACYDAL_01095 [Candidatus Dormibacteraceae bacterium]
MAELFLGSHLALLHANGALTANESRHWWDYLKKAEERGTLLISLTAFIVAGRQS